MLLSHLFLPFYHFFEPAVFNVLWKSYQKISWGYLQYISFHLKNNIFVFFQMPELCTTVFVIFYHFLSIYPLNNPENLNFEKNEKNMPGDIIILHICTLSESHMMYGSRDTECDRQNFLSFYPPNNPKNLNFEKMKKIPGDIIIFYVQQMMIICYVSWNMDSNGQFFCHFGSSFSRKIKILEKWKKHLEISF